MAEQTDSLLDIIMDRRFINNMPTLDDITYVDMINLAREMLSELFPVESR